MLGKGRIIVAHSDHDSGADGESIPRAVVLDMRAGYGCRGEGFVDRWEDSARDR